MPEKSPNMSFILSPSQSVPIISVTSLSDASTSIQEFSRQDKRTITLLPFASVKQDEQHTSINAGVFMKDWKSCPSSGQVTFEFSLATWKVIRRGQATLLLMVSTELLRDFWTQNKVIIIIIGDLSKYHNDTDFAHLTPRSAQFTQCTQSDFYAGWTRAKTFLLHNQ